MLDRTRAAFSFLALSLVACGGTVTGNNPDASTGQGGATGAAGATGAGGTTGQGGTTGLGGTTGQGGVGGATTTIPCGAMNACSCLAASDRCVPRSEACWCPTECYPDAPILCVCGGGRFIGCEDQTVVAGCNEALTAVQTKCAGQSFVGYIGTLCSASAYNTPCVAACLDTLNRTGSCAEIDCSFCPVCDCAAPAMPSRFAACLQACLPTR